MDSGKPEDKPSKLQQLSGASVASKKPPDDSKNVADRVTDDQPRSTLSDESVTSKQTPKRPNDVSDLGGPGILPNPGLSGVSEIGVPPADDSDDTTEGGDPESQLKWSERLTDVDLPMSKGWPHNFWSYV